MFEYVYPAAAFVVGFIVAAFVFRSQKQPPAPVVEAPKPVALPDPNASSLFLLSILQREGRFLDFLQQDVAGFSDEQVGAASRVVHEGCRKVVKQYLDIEPVLKQE